MSPRGNPNIKPGPGRKRLFPGERTVTFRLRVPESLMTKLRTLAPDRIRAILRTGVEQ